MQRMNHTDRKDIHNSDTPVVCRACEVRHQGVCGALDAQQLTRLSKHTTRRRIKGGQELHRGGSGNGNEKDGDDRCSNIMSGVAKLSKLMSDGRQQIVGLQFAPDMVGRTFASDGGVSVEAATDVQICSFPRSVVEEMMTEVPEMEHRLHLQRLKELDEARDWMLTLGRKSAIEKLASFLFLIASHVDPEHLVDRGPMTIQLPMKRSDIADFLGLTIETISRQLTNLRKRGLIEVKDRRTVVINDMQRLLAASEQDLSK